MLGQKYFQLDVSRESSTSSGVEALQRVKRQWRLSSTYGDGLHCVLWNEEDGRAQWTVMSYIVVSEDGPGLSSE